MYFVLLFSLCPAHSSFFCAYFVYVLVFDENTIHGYGHAVYLMLMLDGIVDARHQPRKNRALCRLLSLSPLLYITFAQYVWIAFSLALVVYMYTFRIGH